MLLVLTTVPNIKEAESLARKIIKAKLGACVQVLPQMKSFYFWEGEIRADTEHLLLIKTLEKKYDSLEKFIKENHSYDVPEIITVFHDKVSKDYLNWLEDYLK